MRTDGADLFGTDGRYTTQAATQVPDVEVLVDRATVAGLARAAVRRGAGRLGYESHDLTVDGLAALEKVLADAAAGGTVPELASVRRAVEAQRAIKDDDEIEALRRACAVADQALAELAAEGALRPGRTELQVGRELDARMLRARRRGAVLRDDRGHRRQLGDPAPPARRHRAARRRLPQAGLRRDRRRLPLRHDPHPRARARRGLAAGDLRAGRGRRRRPAGPRWRSARTSSRSTPPPATSSPPPATASTSPTGSGTASGLEIHEAPGIGPLGAGTLAAGMAVTVEPGVYLPGHGGVRIEDTLIVTDDAPELLTLTSKELLVL